MSKQDAIKSYLDNIKSKYILKKIFYNLQKKRFFKITQYNKKYQNRLGISIDDYKKISRIVEIKIIHAKNKYGTIINIVNKEEKSYFHIYFNNCEKEINRNYITKNDNVKAIQDESLKYFNDLFYLCDCIESINFKIFNVYDIKSMKYMFYGCSSLKKLDVSKIETYKITGVIGVFSGCKSLKKLKSF